MIETIINELAVLDEVESPHYRLYPSTIDDVITVIVSDNASTQYVVKYPRFEADSDVIDQTYDTLRYLHTHTEAPFRESIPKPIDRGEVNGCPYVVESTLERSYRSDTTPPTRIKRIVQKGVTWLVEFVTQVKEDPSEQPSEELYRSANRSVDSIYFGPMHGDFTASNILLQASGLPGVIDWGNFCRWGVPVIDLISLFVDMPFYMGETHDPDLFSFVMYEDNRYSRFISRQLERYCSELGLNTVMTRRHNPLWISYSLERARQSRDIAWYRSLQHISEDYGSSRVVI